MKHYKAAPFDGLSTLLDLACAVPLEQSRAAVARVRARTLATIVAALINEHEPLLKAEHDGATVTVHERGGSGVMRFTITDEGDR